MAETHKADPGYAAAGTLLAAAGWIAGTALVGEDPSFKPVEGISVFALVYVLAQAVERVVEGVLAVLEGFAKVAGKQLATTTKAEATRALRSAATAPGVIEQSAKAEAATSDTRALAFGLSLAIGFVACGYFEIGLMRLIGVSGVEGWVDRLASAIIIAGGAKPLHDLISKIQKSKEKDEQTS